MSSQEEYFGLDENIHVRRIKDASMYLYCSENHNFDYGLRMPVEPMEEVTLSVDYVLQYMIE